MPVEPTFEQAETFWIDDAETFEMLADPRRMEIIELAMVPRSVTEMAEIMGVPRTRLYHHVGLLENAGIIGVAETRQAGAATEKLYQTTALNFQPSETLLENAEPREQAMAVIASILGTTQADFLRAVETERVNLTDRRDQRRVAISRRLLLLTPERLDQLIGETEELLLRYTDDPDDAEGAEAVAVLNLIHPSSRTHP